MNSPPEAAILNAEGLLGDGEAGVVSQDDRLGGLQMVFDFGEAVECFFDWAFLPAGDLLITPGLWTGDYCRG